MPYIHPDHRTDTIPTTPDAVLGWYAWQIARHLPGPGPGLTFRRIVNAAHRLHGPAHPLAHLDHQITRLHPTITHEHLAAVRRLVEHEWYRRVVAPYEDTKQADNGDVEAWRPR